MERTRAAVVTGLERKGFVPTGGKHVVVTYATPDGKKTGVRTHCSHSDRKLGTGRLRQMAGQLGLTPEQFLDLVDCPMDRSTFEDMLVARGAIERV